MLRGPVNRGSAHRGLTIIKATGDSDDESNELMADYVSAPATRGNVNTRNDNCSNYIMPDVKVQSL
jgi:hypothetical protein